MHDYESTATRNQSYIVNAQMFYNVDAMNYAKLIDLKTITVYISLQVYKEIVYFFSLHAESRTFKVKQDWLYKPKNKLKRCSMNLKEMKV